jgi:hypothetical protein
VVLISRTPWIREKESYAFALCSVGSERECENSLSAPEGILPLERKTNAEKNAFSTLYASSIEVEDINRAETDS